MTGSKLIYQDLTYQLRGIFYEIQNELGNKFQEKHYCRAIESKFDKYKIQYKREVPIKVIYEGKILGIFKADFIIANKIILEIKTTDRISADNVKQILRYLQGSKLKLGLIINFRVRPLEIKRVINL